MYQQITNYQPYNEQEAKDKELLLKVLKQKDVLTRENEVGHFTVSCWVLNQNHDKILMCYHKIYNSWSWLGGHVDGEKNFKKVALKEVQEESGLENVSFMSDDLFSLDTTQYSGTFDGNNKTVSGLYFNGDSTCIGLFGSSEASVRHADLPVLIGLCP